VAAYQKGEPEAGRMARSLLDPDRLPSSPSIRQSEGEFRQHD
jgi:hypothetical protein